MKSNRSSLSISDRLHPGDFTELGVLPDPVHPTPPDGVSGSVHPADVTARERSLSHPHLVPHVQASAQPQQGPALPKAICGSRNAGTFKPH